MLLVTDHICSDFEQHALKLERVLSLLTNDAGKKIMEIEFQIR
jgi:hypothetical protein